MVRSTLTWAVIGMRECFFGLDFYDFMSRNVILVNIEGQISDMADSINLRSTGGHWGDQIRSKTLI